MISEKDLEKLSYAEAPVTVTENMFGPKTQQVLGKAHKYLSPTRISVVNRRVDVEARGATVKDPDGNVFIDAIAGTAVSSVGRAHPKVVEAIQMQAEKVMHGGSTINTQYVELGKRISDIMPEGLRDNCFTAFLQSGSAAIETAIKYVRAITGKSQIIAFEGAYHGIGCGSLALTTRDEFRTPFGPLIPGVIHMPYAYCYRCFIGMNYPDCKLACAKYFDYKLNTLGTGADDVAAVFIEPIQAEGGYCPPPPEFLGMIKEACDKKGILLVADEIQCGAGRTGKMWASEHYGVVPDMIVFAKGIGCDAPVAGVTVHDKYREKLPIASQPNTFEGNALSSTIALTNIDILTDQDMALIERANDLGEEIKNRFIEAAEEISIIGEVRGKGLMIGIELVEDRETRKPLGNMVPILKGCGERGVAIAPCGRDTNVLRIMPALVISRSLMNKAVDIILDVLKEESKRSE